MPSAWICRDHPEHGAFLQKTLDALAPTGKGVISRALTVTGLIGTKRRAQLEKRAANGEREGERYACPVCQTITEKTGKPHAGAWMRPASAKEAARAAQQEKQEWQKRNPAATAAQESAGAQQRT